MPGMANVNKDKQGTITVLKKLIDRQGSYYNNWVRSMAEVGPDAKSTKKGHLQLREEQVSLEVLQVWSPDLVTSCGTWELAGDAESQAPTQTNGIRICILSVCTLKSEKGCPTG